MVMRRGRVETLGAEKEGGGSGEAAKWEKGWEEAKK
jgi:hypothetical protein